MDGAGDADSPSLSQSFDTSRNVDPIPVDPLFLLDYISKVNADTKFHPAVIRQLSVPNPEFLLDLHSTTHRINHT